MRTATAVRERPIIFTGDSVQAILDGRKTQTRRVVRFTAAGYVKEPRGHRRWHRNDQDALLACPYGQPGDHLWVRETCLRSGDDFMSSDHEDYDICYPRHTSKLNLWRVCSPIHMPRWASRLTLEVTEVRVQRVQEISEADARAEGVIGLHEIEYRKVPKGDTRCLSRFAVIWGSLNAKRGYGWDVNPWVWAISFRVVEPFA